MSAGTLLWGLLWGTLGFAYFIYGKKESNASAMLCGVGLMIFPYFVSNVILLALVGLVLAALPFFARL